MSLARKPLMSCLETWSTAGECGEYLQDQVSQSEQHPLLLVQMMSALETFKQLEQTML